MTLVAFAIYLSVVHMAAADGRRTGTNWTIWRTADLNIKRIIIFPKKRSLSPTALHCNREATTRTDLCTALGQRIVQKPLGGSWRRICQCSWHIIPKKVLEILQKKCSPFLNASLYSLGWQFGSSWFYPISWKNQIRILLFPAWGL